MIRPSESDDIDFKPFFDMIVGVLFILLILVAAQLFFSRWNADDGRPPPQSNLFEQEAGQLFDALKAQLQAQGFTPVIDRSASRIGLPLTGLVATSEAGLPQPEPAALVRLGRALSIPLGCIDGPADATCPSYRSLRLAALRPSLTLSGLPSAGALAPDAAVRLLGTSLYAGLVTGAPALLKLRNDAGQLALQPLADPTAIGSAPTPQGGFAGHLDIVLQLQRREP